MLEVLDIFEDKQYSGSFGMPSWTLDFNRKQPKYVLPQPRFQAEKTNLKVPRQDHLDAGRLRSAGVQVARSILRLDGEKEIGHPQDRFVPKYRAYVTLRHLPCKDHCVALLSAFPVALITCLLLL